MLGTTREQESNYNIVMNVETAAERGEMSTVYRLAKQLCRHIQASVSIVKNKDRNPLTTEETKALNIESVIITADPPTPNDDLDIATGVPTLQEVTHAIQQMKSGNAHGTHNICTDAPDKHTFCRQDLH